MKLFKKWQMTEEQKANCKKVSKVQQKALMTVFFCFPLGVYSIIQTVKYSIALEKHDELRAMQCERKVRTAFKLMIWLNVLVLIGFVVAIACL